ncbi:MAG: FAD-binding oxidoreductase [Alkalibacterium sp.]|uniref:FAD-binding oxidoreductase n=1 Tax=Alkalibacterium sp. TaxID=1872447 RepID=UPI002647C8F4|nr:FAD-binding oxidoreductase [Alkalibacterium sp.]MDN6293348.1 FAD-binding oxidoreductase [Alkalibacterium sp.]MDN6295664.1 FAD-binding oxidoreductase [Alkalibacterium sp.]MDN6326939.1 FAD-binding oxidoreductase [Alkalibacterium sp.]MDN6398282.1 FAD-binding oxidoreductase [Alkalibacterium sp.]
MSQLENIITDVSRLFIGEAVPDFYYHDTYVKNIKPVYAVALPKSHEEVKALVRFAIEKDLVIIARGAGSGVAGAQVPIKGNELIIDLHLMNRIIQLDEETLTLTVEPGVLIGNIHDFVEKKGYFYPPDPASKHSTIGGNVATNAGGLRAVKYGTTRDYVREMTVVLPDGEEMTLGSLNIKSSSGYDLKDLFIGSEGTLGITTHLRLKLIPLPKANVTILQAFETAQKATEATLEILKSGVDPSGVELFERSALHYAEENLGYPLKSQVGQAYLMISLDGNDQKELDGRIDTVQSVTKHLTLESHALNAEEAKKNWALRDNILLGLTKFTEFELLDEVVPINKFAELIEATKAMQEKHGLNVLNFGHAGDGNVHTLLMKDDLTEEAWTKKRAALLKDLYHKVDTLGGLPSAEHGIGIVKKEYMDNMTQTINLEYMRQIKKIFDPENRLNPDKIF